jgi:peptidoglycan/LPS O-acetylase OafA/YrhL
MSAGPQSAKIREFVFLDLLRGFSAVLVLLGHLRALIFEDYAKIAGSFTSVPVRLWYFVTSLGAEAVLVFFVLSGFFITRSISGALQRGRWSWGFYVVQRLTRLELVLVPALLLTFVLDVFSLRFAPHAAIYGADAPAALSSARHAGEGGLAGFLGNAAFLQTIIVQPFGSNSPLWSLANEFWYYMAFPCFVLAFANYKGSAKSALMIFIGLAILIGVGWGISSLFGVWLCGAAAFILMPYASNLPRCFRALLLVLFGAGFIAVLVGRVARVVPDSLGSDYLVGLMTAGLAVLLARYGSLPSAVLSRGIHALADRSYSLYVIHLPLILSLAAWTWGVERQTPGPGAFVLFFGALCVVGLVTEGFYRCFERNTETVRRWIWCRLSRRHEHPSQGR